MKTRLRKGKDFLKRISAGAAAALMAVVTVISNMEPMVAKAEGYTLIGYDNDVSYADVFRGIDDGMGDWKSWEFSVEEPDGDVVKAMCAEPHKMQPGIGSTFTDGDTYVNDTVARVFFFSIGSGASRGPLSGYDYNLRWIIAHHTVAYALDDDMWNEPAIGGTFLGGPGSAGYDLCMELYSYAYNLSSGDYDCYAKFLSNDDGVNQSLCIFWDEPAPTYYNGNFRFRKYSSNDSISNDNSCYSLQCAEISVYNDAECTDLVTRLTTNSDGYTDTYTTGDILEGESRTYYYKETGAPKGFLINDSVESVTITSSDTVTCDISDTPETDPVTILLRKVNKETGSVSNGAGTLKGAKYVIKYYDTDMTTDPAASGKTPKYTYYAQTGADGRIRLRDSQCYIGGDTLFKDDRDNVVFPLGTLTIQEYDAPEGYLLDETVFVNNIFKNKIYVNGMEQTTATSYQEADSTVIHLEQEVKGKVSLTKKMTAIKDGGSYVKTAQKSSLTENVPEEGAEFQIYYKAAGSYEAATEAQRDILRTGADGKATSKDLPYGNYVIHQISGAPNCTFMEDMEVSISENAKTYEVSATDIQKLNKLRLYKKGEVVTGYNKDTGFVYEERYIGGCSYQVYADEDCSDAGFIEQITSKDGGYAESAYEYKAGTYYIREAKAADGYMLDTTVYKIEVTTDGDNVVGFTDVVRTDSRQKVNVTAHKKDKEDSKPLAGAKFGIYATSDIKSRDGAVLVKKGDLIETMTTGENGAVSSAYDLPIGYVYEVREDYSPIGYGNAFETKKVNASKVLGYGDVPSQDFDMVFVDDKTIIVKTKAADYKTGDNQGSYDEGMSYKVTDSVYLDNLMPGKTYTINGKLMDRATEQPFLDASGNEVTGTATFKAESKEQVVKVEFNFKGNLEGKSTVVFEDLIEEGVKIYTHADIKDENQTVDYPKIRTKAQDSKTKDNVGTIAATSSIIDTVKYSNLKVGNTYNVSGYLMDKDTGKPFLDANGNKITAEKTFTAETSDGSVDMTFTFDSSLLEDTTLVVFEDVFYNGVKVATHSDIGDEEQSIHYIKLRTTAKDTITDSHVGTVSKVASVIDTVKYNNLIIGKTYTVSGYLMVKETGKPLLDADGNKVTAEKTFTAAQEDGSIDLMFTFDSRLVEGQSVVVFEDMYYNGVKVGTHSDINDEGQTVHYPKLKTRAIDSATKDHVGTVSKTATIIDTVDYTNLIVGTTYTVSGYLMVQETREPLLDENGNKITAETTFTATTANGAVDMVFKFDSSLLGDNTLTCFEDLKYNNVTVATHSDITDEEQSVHYIDLKTKAIDKNTGNNVGTVQKNATIIDTVSYKNLIVGKEYTVSGHLMVKDTNSPLLDANGNKITATKTFIADKKDGTIDMTFEFDSSLLGGETIVVFEKLIHNGIEVAAHEDINDEDQSVHYPVLKTTAKDTTTVVDATKRTDDTTPLQITDTVEYTNLIPGVTYKVVGKLMDKVTGKPLADGKITSEVTFTPEEADGTVDVVFNFTRAELNSLNIVVFEDIYDAASNVLVATHSDINDEGQTVTFKSVVNIEKLDSTGIIKQLDGATLEILDLKGNVVYGPFVTTGTATEILGLLPDVEYILREVKAPAGFELAKDVKFTLKDSARIQHVSMTDEAIIGYLNFAYNSTNDWNKAGEVASNEETVKTGDSNTDMVRVYAVIMFVSALGMILVAIRKNRKGIVKLFGIFAVVMVAGLASVTTNTYAAESYKVTEKYTDKDAKKEYNFDKTVEKDGVTYQLSDVKYDAIEKKVPADVTKTLEMKSALTTYADAEFGETVEKDGITYKLAGVEKDVTGVAGRTQYHEENVNYNEVTGDKAISDTINSTVTDPVTGKDYGVTLSLVSKKVVKSAVSDEFKFDITFYVTNGRYFRYKDKLVTYNENTPDVMQFSDEILSDLNLDPELYKINSIEWDGEAYTNEDGVLCRKAAAVGNRVINDYEVVYGGDYNLPADANAYNWVGKYEATVNDPVGGTEYDITATATYTEYIAGQVEANEEKANSSGFITFVKNHPAAFAGVSVLIIAALVIVFLFFLKVRKSNKYPQE